MPPISKRELRAAISKKLATFSSAERRAMSAIIQRKLLGSPYYREARNLLAYASFSTEVETDQILDACLRDGKRLVLTRIDQRDKSITLHAVKQLANELELNGFGIREPRHDAPRVADADIDTILVPGLAFTESGARLGRGQGYYDRLLARCPAAKTIALAFDIQVFSTGYFQTEAHDCGVSAIFTELREFKL